jgi:hypothetical protein
MRARNIAAIVFLVCLGTAATAVAQYGHPLKGQWSGDWGPNASTRNRVLVDLNWDGKAITGVIHPSGATTATTLSKVTADPVTPTFDAWTVHMEGPGGLIIDGKVVNLGSYYRTMSGTWTQGGVKGTFNLTRN